MNYFQQIADWLGIELDGGGQQNAALREAMENGQRLKRLGNYDEALAAFEQAEELARKARGKTLPVLIALHRADVLTLQDRLDEAEALLIALRREAEATDQKAQIAYILCALGVVAQRRESWDGAREYYERALKLAREARTAGAEGRAQGHLADTYLHDDNASFAVYLLREALPKLTMSGDIELSSYFSGRLGEGLIAIGQRTEGQQYLGRALRLAEQLEHRQHEELWRRLLAEEAMAEGHYAEARRHLMLILARPTARSTEADQVATLGRLSKTCLRLGEYDAALDYANQAVELVGDCDPAADACLIARAALGIALRVKGRYAQAAEQLEAIVDHYDRLITGDVDHTYIDLVRNLAATRAELTDYDAAQTIYERALNHAQEQESRLSVADIQRDMGILHMRRGAFQQAIDTWNAALGIYAEEGQHGRVSRLYCDIANIRRQMGQGKRAMKDFEEALMLLSSVDDPETRGIVLANAATAYIDKGDIETADSFFVEAIRIAQDLNDPIAEATRRGNYGWFLLSTGRAQRALTALAYALQQSQNLGLQLQTAVQTDNTGLAHDELGNRAEAESYHREALDRIAGLSPPFWEGIFSANLAHTLIALDRDDEAASLLERALEIGRKVSNTEVITRSLNGQAKLALKRGGDDEAGTIIEEAVRLAEQGSYRRLLADALILRSELRARNGQRDESAADWERARELLQALRISAADGVPSWLG
jgi:tetratricopeptide (TPR) repeat protein